MWMKFSASAFSILATPPVQTSKMSENYETLIYINMHINITNKKNPLNLMKLQHAYHTFHFGQLVALKQEKHSKCE